MADINQVLHQVEQRAGHTYYSPAHVVTADDGQFGTPWWIAGPVQFGQWLAVTVSAPPRPQKGAILHQVKGIENSQIIGYGQANTSGVYTGVEDTCS